MCQWGSLEHVKLNRPRPTSGRIVIPVDSCIAPLVQLLQDHGVRTVGCCCGHGEIPGFITYEDSKGIIRDIPLRVIEEKEMPTTQEIQWPKWKVYSWNADDPVGIEFENGMRMDAESDDFDLPEDEAWYIQVGIESSEDVENAGWKINESTELFEPPESFDGPIPTRWREFSSLPEWLVQEAKNFLYPKCPQCVGVRTGCPLCQETGIVPRSTRIAYRSRQKKIQTDMPQSGGV